MSAVVGAALCGVAAGVGNVVNQYANYKIEKKAQTRNKKSTSNSQKSNSTGKKLQHHQTENWQVNVIALQIMSMSRALLFQA